MSWSSYDERANAQTVKQTQMQLKAKEQAVMNMQEKIKQVIEVLTVLESRVNHKTYVTMVNEALASLLETDGENQ